MLEERRDVELQNLVILCRCKGDRQGMLAWDPQTQEFKYFGSCHRTALCAIIQREKFLTRLAEMEEMLQSALALRKAIIIES